MSASLPQRVRRTTRAAVNAVHAFFEQHDCVFQEVAQQNDFGKDAYVDLADSGRVTGRCVALQIKGGASYRTADGGYAIPLGKHAATWRHSTIPVIGIVHDPRDATLNWVDLTGFLRSRPDLMQGLVRVPPGQVLDKAALAGPFAMAVGKYGLARSDEIALKLLSNVSDTQLEAVYDAWALGRFDARYLIILRRLILDLPNLALHRAIGALAHVTSHPDIFWSKENWIQPAVRAEVRRVLRWSPEEIAHLFMALDFEEWGRGTRGQDLDLLLDADPEIDQLLPLALERLVNVGETEHAIRVAAVSLCRAKHPRRTLVTLESCFPSLCGHEWFQAIAQTVAEEGRLDCY